MRKYILAATAALLSLAPLAASAQDVPSYAQGGGGGGDEQIRGRVISFDGAYAVTVRDDRGFVDNIELHQGTIINPTGITIAPNMVVSILGYNGGNVFEANEVDTPYTFYGGEPYYGGHPWNYYGPTIGFDFFFGNVGWWHGSYFNGGYRYDRGARIYSNVNVTRIYNNYGGSFRGRNYVAASGHAYVPGRTYQQYHNGASITTNVNRNVYNHTTTNVNYPHTTNVTNQGYHNDSTQITHNYNRTVTPQVTHNYTRTITPQTSHVYNGAGRIHSATIHTGGVGHPGGAVHTGGGGAPHGGGHDNHR